jgi:hypothetical protein
MASDPTIKAALEAAALGVCSPGSRRACKTACVECVRQAQAAIAAFLRALPGSTRNDGALWWYQIPADTETHHWLAAAVEEAARDE